MSLPINIINPADQLPDQVSQATSDVSSPQEEEQKAPVDPKKKKRNDEFRQRIDICKVYRRKLVGNWNTSIDFRRGKPFASASDEDQIAVPLDWSLTKTKLAALFSQVPQVRVDHAPQSTQAGPWLSTFERKLNDTLIVAGVEGAMDETLPDCINAAGIGVVIVSYEAITQDKQVPAIDPATLAPELQQELAQNGTVNGEPVKMETVPEVVDHRYVIQRVSPSDFLWPVDFSGSNFDKAPWLGRSGRVTWAEAVQRFNLKEEDKESLTGGDKTSVDRLAYDVERDALTSYDNRVGFEEIFFKEHVYDIGDPEAKSFNTVHHLVFVNGKDSPVIDEPWKGQKLDPQVNLPIGSMKFPIRVLTLAYVTDETIPPSDSAIGRPQVNEINALRSNAILQRKRSLPVRWIDPNRVDPLVLKALMNGSWQQMVPIQGDGARAIGEVARAAFPPENSMFEMNAKRDLEEAWTIGPNQMGSGADVETKGESGQIAEGFQTRIGRERAKVASFFVGISEVLGGLLALYEDPNVFGEGFDKSISQALSYSILADSTVLLDARQRLERLNQFINMYAKSGWVSLEPVLKEAATLSGLDPNAVIKPPDPKPPVEPNISLRLTGTEDMMNPLTLAMMIKAGQAPDPDLIEKAKQLIQQAVVSMPQPPPGMPATQGGLGAPPPLPPPGSPVDIPPPPPVPTGEDNPDMNSLPKITKRSNAPVEES